MDFSLNEEQRTFQTTARQFIESKGGIGLSIDYTEQNEDILVDFWKEFGELGYFAINVPEEYGGIGMGALTLVPVLEEIGRAVLPGPFVETMAFATPLISKYGTEEQKQKYLPAIAEGKLMVTLAVLEDGVDLQPESIQLEATEEKDNYLLSGKKILVPNADVADTLILVARTKKGYGKNGISLFIVDAEDVQWESKSINNIDETRKLSNVTFDNVTISKDQLLGEEHEGWEVLQDGIINLSAGISSVIVGGIEKTVEMSTEYGKMREQFGQPIGRFQAIKHSIVDMKVKLDSSRSLSYYAAWALETGAEDAIEAISLARSYASEAYIDTASANIQIHGGMGFTWELECHYYLKRSRSYENYLGTPDYYRELAATNLGW